jgi:hypothetical protein
MLSYNSGPKKPKAEIHIAFLQSVSRKTHWKVVWIESIGQSRLHRGGRRVARLNERKAHPVLGDPDNAGTFDADNRSQFFVVVRASRLEAGQSKEQEALAAEMPRYHRWPNIDALELLKSDGKLSGFRAYFSNGVSARFLSSPRWPYKSALIRPMCHSTASTLALRVWIR